MFMNIRSSPWRHYRLPAAWIKLVSDPARQERRAEYEDRTTWRSVRLLAASLLCLPALALGHTGQTISFFPISSQVYAPGGSFLVYASASSGLPVTFSSDTPAVCRATGNNIGIMSAGTCTIRASQAGDATYAAAAEMLDSIAITPAPQVIFLSIPSSLELVESPVALSVVSTSGLPVTVVSRSPSVCSFSSVYILMRSTGTCAISISQPGNGNYQAANTIDTGIPITPATTRVTVSSSLGLVAYGTPVTLFATVHGFAPAGFMDFLTASSNGYMPVCAKVPVAGGNATCNVSGSFLHTTPVYFVATYGGDSNNQAASGSYQQVVATGQTNLSAGHLPRIPVAGGTVALSALVTRAESGGRVTFSENGSALPGCSDVMLVQFGSTENHMAGAGCDVVSVGAGEHTYVVTVPNATGSGFDQVFHTVSVNASGPQDYTGMWWAGLAENGWGMSVDQHGPTQFVLLYVYDNTGKPTWFAMPGGSWDAAGTSYSGALYQPSGSPFAAYDASKFAANAPVGTATVVYHSTTSATLIYTINGTGGSKQIIRQTFGDGAKVGSSIGDMWWGGQQENGWGLNITQQGSVLFPVWYTYDANGRATWYVMPGGEWNGSTYTGDLYQPSSSAWLGVPYRSAEFNPVKTGRMSLTIVDVNTVVVAFDVAGVTRTTTIVREPF